MARVTTMIPVGMQPAGLSIIGDGRYVIAAVQGDGQAVIIDTGSDTVQSDAKIGKAHNSGLSRDGSQAFVASQVVGAPAVAVVRVPGATVGPSFALDATPRALCELDGKLYVTVAGSGAIEVLDSTSGQTETPIETAGSPHDIRPSSDGSLLFTVSQAAGELEWIDPKARTIVARVATGNMPHWIGLSSDGAFAYVTNEADNNLSVIDLTSRALKSTISVGQGPRKIAVQP